MPILKRTGLIMMKHSFFSYLHGHFGRSLFTPGTMLSALGVFLLLLFLSFLLAEEFGKLVQRFTLKNGLRLLLLERHLSPMVAIYNPVPGRYGR
jgi:hypothetical protein